MCARSRGITFKFLLELLVKYITIFASGLLQLVTILRKYIKSNITLFSFILTILNIFSHKFPLFFRRILIVFEVLTLFSLFIVTLEYNILNPEGLIKFINYLYNEMLVYYENLSRSALELIKKGYNYIYSLIKSIWEYFFPTSLEEVTPEPPISFNNDIKKIKGGATIKINDVEAVRSIGKDDYLHIIFYSFFGCFLAFLLSWFLVNLDLDLKLYDYLPSASDIWTNIKNITSTYLSPLWGEYGTILLDYFLIVTLLHLLALQV